VGGGGGLACESWLENWCIYTAKLPTW